MLSKNWGYTEFNADVEQVFSSIFAAHNFVITSSTDQVSYVNYKNNKVMLYIAFDDSKVVESIFKTPTGETYNIHDCCLIKGITYAPPICEFRDRNCIQKGLTYIAGIIKTHFQQELQGHFSYQEEIRLFKEEQYFLNKKLAFLPLRDTIKQKYINSHLPNAGIAEMRERLIKKNLYPEKFRGLYNRYFKNKNEA